MSGIEFTDWGTPSTNCMGGGLRSFLLVSLPSLGEFVFTRHIVFYPGRAE